MMSEEPKGFEEWWNTEGLRNYRIPGDIESIVKAAWNQAIDCALYLVEAKEGHDYDVRKRFEVKTN